MRVVALLSGGKDSCYSVLKCQEHGHEVVALAHIAPEDPNTQEADSFMYQTVGSEAVQAVADALEIPLFVGTTRAKALDTDLQYAPSPGDEVEDLHALLVQVKDAVQGITGVCSGAIFSDYQRLRVESVCSRLGLVSLAYLWRRNQRELLDEMIAAGIEAIVIKVAAMGLNSSHLGRTLADLRDELHQLDDKYGIHVCGEGGEFETFVVDCPLFRKRIRIDACQKVIISDDMYAPVAILRIDEWRLQDKKPAIETSAPISEQSPTGLATEVTPRLDNVPAPIGIDHWDSRTTVTGSEAIITITSQEASPELSAYEAVDLMMQRVEKEVERASFRMEDAYYCIMSLRDMRDFPEANKAYGNHLSTCPPSRACLELSFETNRVANVSLKLHRGARTNIHVQSLSEWAPPCIGPYSQFSRIAGSIHVSGVIALSAVTGALIEERDFSVQFEKCRENLVATLEVPDVGLEALQSVVVFVTTAEDRARGADLIEDMITCAPGATFSVMIVNGLPRGALVELMPVLSDTSDPIGSHMDQLLTSNKMWGPDSSSEEVSLYLSNRRLLHAIVNFGPDQVQVIRRLEKNLPGAQLSLVYHEECVNLAVNCRYLAY